MALAAGEITLHDSWVDAKGRTVRPLIRLVLVGLEFGGFRY